MCVPKIFASKEPASNSVDHRKNPALQHLQALQPFRPKFLSLPSSQEGKFHLAGKQLQPPIKQHQEQTKNAHAALVAPPYRQDPLLRQLKIQPDEEHENLQPPFQHQDPLLRQLKAKQQGGKEGLLAPKLLQTGLTSHQRLPLHRNGEGRFLSPPKPHLKSDRIMNMANAAVGPESKSSDHTLSADKKQRLLNMEAKVKALLFELEPSRQKPLIVESEQRHQQTAPLILDNSAIIGQQFAEFQKSDPKQSEDRGGSSGFEEHSKRSKFQSLLTEISKAMVVLESVSKTRI